MNLQVGVKVLIKNSEDKYLLLQRAGAMDNETEAHWDIPGGRIEPEEPLITALAREISEETGLTLTDTPRLLGAQDIFVSSKGLHVVRLTYVTEGDGDPILSDEHQNTTWVSRKAMLELNLDPYLRALLEQQKNT